MAIPAHLGARSQRGLSLVELMVGLALGMIVAAALLLLFANVSQNGQNLQRASSHIENGRYAAELLRDDLQLAGYFGETVTTTATYTTPDPCATAPTGFTASPLGLPTAVRGYAATDALGCLGNRRPGTDALAVRRLEVVTVDAASLAAGNRQHHVQYSFCQTDPTSTPLVFAADPAAFTLNNRACAASNPLRAYVSRVYFVAECNRCDGGGDNVPTLKRVDLVGDALVETALVEGVESLRMEYGFDLDGDGVPDSYLTTAGAGGPSSLWENVVTLKLHFIVRSLERVIGAGLASEQSFDLGGAGTVTMANDGFARRAYTSTVRLINVSSARESQ